MAPGTLHVMLGAMVLGAIILCLSTSNVHGEDEVQDTWVNSSNLTGMGPINCIEINSRDDSIFILSRLYVEEWGVWNHRFISELYLDFEGSNDMDWNPEQEWLAIKSDGDTMDDKDMSPLEIIDVDGEILYEFHPWGDLPAYPDSTIVDLEWRPNSTELAILFYDGTLRIYEVRSQEVVHEWKHEGNGKTIVWDPSGEYLSVMLSYRTMERDVHVIGIETETIWQVIRKQSAITDMGWSHDSSVLLLHTHSKIQKYSLETSEISLVLEINSDGFFPSPAREEIAIVDETRGITFFDYVNNTTEKHQIRRGIGTHCEWSADGSFFIFDELGSGVLRIWSRRPDLPPPQLDILSPLPDSTVKGTIEITGWVQSAHQENGIVTVKVGNKDWQAAQGFRQWSYTLDTTLVPDGHIIIKAKALDPSGESEIVPLELFIDNDKVTANLPPTIDITSHEDGQVVKGHFEIHGIANDDREVISIQLKRGFYFWEELEISEHGERIEWSCHILLITERGNLTIQARAYDGFHYSNVASVVINATAPDRNSLTIRIDNPEMGSTVLGDFVTKGVVEGGVPEQVFIGFDYRTVVMAEGTSQWRYAVSDLLPGYHFLTVYAMDSDGISEGNSVPFIVGEVFQNERPRVGFNNIEDDAVIKADHVIKGWSSDDERVEKVRVRVNGNDWTDAEGTTKWSYTLRIADLEGGWNTIESQAFDGEMLSYNASVRIVYVPDVVVGPSNSTPANNDNNNLIYIIITLLIIIIIEMLYIYSVKRTQ